MSNFAGCILVKLVPSEPDFASLTTYDKVDGVYVGAIKPLLEIVS